MLKIVAVFFLVVGFMGQAHASQPVAYTAPAFAAAQAAGRPILLHITAPWCPVCAKQQPILSQLEQTPELSEIVVFNIDFDSQKDVLQTLGVQKQSTLIVYSGKIEKGRATGITDAGEIKALLLKAKST